MFDWHSAPGDTLQEIMYDMNLSIVDMAKIMVISEHTVRGILQGELDITPDYARILARVTGASVEFWLRRQSQYYATIASLIDAAFPY